MVNYTYQMSLSKKSFVHTSTFTFTHNHLFHMYFFTILQPLQIISLKKTLINCGLEENRQSNFHSNPRDLVKHADLSDKLSMTSSKTQLDSSLLLRPTVLPISKRLKSMSIHVKHPVHPLRYRNTKTVAIFVMFQLKYTASLDTMFCPTKC